LEITDEKGLTMPRVVVLLTLACGFFIADAASQVQPPGAPVATAATNVGQTSFTANWDTSARATSYLLSVATDSIFRLIVPGYNNLNVGNVLTRSVTGLGPDTTYYYRLRASNAGGTSGNSNPITVTTLVATPPAPVATGATNVGQTSFTANWNASPGATTYLLDVAADTAFVSIVPGFGNLNAGNVLNQNVTGLAAGSKYYYRVRAANVGGTSGSSNVISLTTVVGTPPPPVAAAPTNITQTSFTANWNAAARATAYFFDVASDTSFTSILPAYNNLNLGSLLTQNVTGLTAGAKYFYRVRGSNVGGTSGSSNIVSVTTVVATPPAPVAGAASNIGQTSFTANWGASAGAAAYLLDVAADTNFTSILPAYGNLNVGSVLAQNVIGLSPATKYYYRVRGSNIGGTSGSSNTVSVTTVVATPPAPVATPGTNITQTSFTAGWNSSAGATAYVLDAATDTNFTAMLSGFSNLNVGNVLTRNITGLSGGTKYFYRVRGTNIGGTSGNSNIISLTTVVATPPAPLATAGTIVAQTSFTANWNASPGGSAYLLDVATDTGFSAAIAGYNNLNVGNVLTRNVTGLTPATTYYYRVRGSNPGGTSGNSNTILVTTVGVPPPAPVLTAPASGSTGQPVTLSLSWNPSPGSLSYVVQVSTTPTFLLPFISDSAVTGTTRALSGLARNTLYYWRVAGKNQFGIGGFSSPAFTFSTVATASVTGTVLFPPNPAQSDYRMVSLPGAVPGLISDLTAGSGGLQKFDWRAFRVPDSGVLTELGPQDQMNAGEGVWLLRKNTLSITRSLVPPALQANGVFPIQIHSGWNIVANPFEVPVRWDAVRAQNGLLLSDVIQSWSGSYAVDSVMQPFQGYYFLNTSSETTTLAIPYPLPSTVQPVAYASRVLTWSLQVAFESAENVDTDCHLGVSPGTVSSGDSLQIRKPPLAFAGGEVYFSRSDADGSNRRFSTDYRPGVAGSEEWDVQIFHPRGCNGVLRFDGVDGVPAKYRVILVSPADGRPIDLRSQREYRLQTTVTGMTARVLVGLDSDIERTLATLLPGSYSLEQNYPNPFNPTTTIRYGLPQRSTVNIAIFNSLGQQVKQLASGEEEAGFHEVKVDGAGMASGVYFYRLRAGSFVETKRFVLLH
jgi:phosphodiesterase/alkaline phosphatase D-like protein